MGPALARSSVPVWELTRGFVLGGWSVGGCGSRSFGMNKLEEVEVEVAWTVFS